jgi:hypothetical protein
VDDVTHKVIAVGSRSVESAKNFIEINAKGDVYIKAYGSYGDIYKDKVCLSLDELHVLYITIKYRKSMRFTSVRYKTHHP